MCGIAGYFSTTNAFNKGHTQQMLQCLKHRGPDAEGIYQHHHVSLGHRRLSIIDLSSDSNQPMIDASGRYVMVFNGEIYNYIELAQQFKLTLKTHSDTEVALALIAQNGIEAVKLFEGMFAIAVYDNIDEILYLVRDGVGIKPLYYYNDGVSVVFASELKALKVIGLCNEINQQAIFNYLYAGYIAAPESIYSKVYKLKPGHILIVNKHGLQAKVFWHPGNELSNQTNTDVDVLESLLLQSVKQHMRSDVPFGVFLSGGTDSSLIAALAAKQTKSLQTFSIGFTDVANSEAKHAALVASHLKTQHHTLEVTYAHAIEKLMHIMQQFDEPFADSSALPTYLVSELAGKQVKVVLSGDGGDELFMGYGAYKWAKRLHRPYMPFAASGIKSILKQMPPRYKRVAGLFNFNHDFLPAHIFSQEQYLFSMHESKQMLFNSQPYHEMFYNEFKSLNHDKKISAAAYQSLYDLCFYLPDDLLVKVDRTSMLCSIEARVPLLDRRLIAFALNVPEPLKMHGNQMKIMLKQVLYKYVPKPILDRPKQGFSIPLQQWLQGPLHFLVEDLLSQSAINNTGILNAKNVSALVKSWKNGNHFLYNRVWQLIVLQNFLKNNKR